MIFWQKDLSEIGCTNDFDFTSSKEDILSKLMPMMPLLFEVVFQLIKALDSAKHLRFIARVGSGLENIDVSYAKDIGIEAIASLKEMPMPWVNMHCMIRRFSINFPKQHWISKMESGSVKRIVVRSSMGKP